MCGYFCSICLQNVGKAVSEGLRSHVAALRTVESGQKRQDVHPIPFPSPKSCQNRILAKIISTDSFISLNGRCATSRYLQVVGSIHDIESYFGIDNTLSLNLQITLYTTLYTSTKPHSIKSLHLALSLILASCTALTSTTTQHIYSLTPYFYLSYDHIYFTALYVHHSYITSVFGLVFTH